VAKGFRTHVTVQGNGSWIWDQGIVPIVAGDNLDGSPDTSHANREPMMVVAMYESGVEFTLPDLKAMASTFTTFIWNHNDANPMFTNYIDGGNATFSANQPWENGVVFPGWAMLGRHSAEVQRVVALSYQYILTQRPLNASLASNNSPYGLTEFAGTLALNEVP